jgi:hypothetical protein
LRSLFSTSSKGYILLDILVGLFIFGVGFSATLGIINTAVLARGQADNYLQAVNLASSSMDETLNNLGGNSACKYTYLSGEVSNTIGNFERVIKAEWDSIDLLLLTVEVRWMEKGEIREYILESLFYVQE